MNDEISIVLQDCCSGMTNSRRPSRQRRAARRWYQAKKLFELSSAPRHPEEFDDITPYIDWLWANEPEDARKLQLELLLLEVMEETVDWALAIGSDGVKHDLDFRTAIVERFEDALRAKAMKLPDRFTKDGPAYPRSERWVEFIDENGGGPVSGCGSGSRKKARAGVIANAGFRYDGYRRSNGSVEQT